MAVWAVGDLQGCHAAFVRLLAALRFSPDRDQLWLTGDLVNRGPDSLGTLRQVMALGAGVTTVLGNHDLHLLALALAPAAGRGLRAGDTLEAILTAPDRDHLLEWLLYRPLLHQEPSLRWTLVHAGLPPQWNVSEAAVLASEVAYQLRAHPETFLASMYGDRPEVWTNDLQGADRWRFVVNCLTRLRYCALDGRLLPKLKGPPALAPPDALPWFEVPERRSAGEPLVFGHWSALGLHRAPAVLGLDTGCVWGGALSAVRLDVDEPPERWPLVQVSAT